MAGDREFPEGFLWGAATAAYQIEGAAAEGGRGPSIWDTFSHEPGRTLNGDNGDDACRHYARLEEDLDLMAGLGLKAYRFSIAWPRVQREGRGSANQEGLDFYRRLVSGLRQRGVVPLATLYHWDLPQALEDAGGWPARDTAARFADYARLVVEALGDQVGMWATLNEPWCSAWLGYGFGEHAPGRSDIGLALSATHHLLLGHAWASEVLRAATNAPVGIALNTIPAIPASAHPLDVRAARTADGGVNRMFLDPLFKGRYPEDIVGLLSAFGIPFSAVQDGDMEAISRPLDFLGVNYYTTIVVADPGRQDEARHAGYFVPGSGAGVLAAGLPIAQVVRPGLERTANDLEVDPEGLTTLLVRLRDEYTDAPLYITENGVAQHDYRGTDGAVHDTGRANFLARHVQAARDAIEQGVDVRGYFTWSLLDNFEWSLGYSKRFGLVWVDYPTGDRVPKDSYCWYREVIAANGLPAGGQAEADAQPEPDS